MAVHVLLPYMPITVSMALTLIPSHSRSAKATNQRYMLSATKQAIISIIMKIATSVGHFYVTLHMCIYGLASLFVVCYAIRLLLYVSLLS